MEGIDLLSPKPSEQYFIFFVLSTCWWHCEVNNYNDYNDYDDYNDYRDSDLDLDWEWFSDSDFSDTVDKLRNLHHDIEEQWLTIR